MLNEYQLSGRSALVTGVSRSVGIGAAVARGLAALGANVFTTYYRPFDGADGKQEDAALILSEIKASGVKASGVKASGVKASGVKASGVKASGVKASGVKASGVKALGVKALGVKAQGFEADLADIAAPKAIFDLAEEAVGPIDILVNNAACDYECDIYSVTPALLDAHYWVNLRGTTLLCAEFAKRHDGQPGGRIINLTSGQSIDAMETNLPYAMTKGAVEVLTKALSVSLKPKGITVNAVDPGGTDTGWMSPELMAGIKENTLYGRVGTPQDATRLILFLASAQAEWITGQILHSRGGL